MTYFLRYIGPLGLLLAIVLAPVAAMADDHAAGSGVNEMADLRGPTLAVNDLEASVAFFTTVLGLKAGETVVYNSPVLRVATGAPEGADIRVVALNDRKTQWAVVLVAAQGLVVDTKSNAINAAALSWRVDNIDAVYARALEAGYGVVMSLEEAAEAEDYPPEKEMVLLSPSGHRLIVIQPPEGF